MSTYDTDPYANQSTGAGQSTDSGDMKERAKDTAAEVGAGAKNVAGVAGEEVKGVARDAKSAARGFFDETRSQLSDQASTQQRRAAGALRSTSDELQGLASGTTTGSGGVATSAVRAVGEQTRRVADWLEQREPADVVYEVRSFARRNTGAFLAIAAAVGVVAGRLTRSLVSEARSDNGTQGTLVTTRPGYSAGSTVGGYGTAGGTTAAGLGTGAAGVGGYEGDTPIGDSLSSDPLTGDPLAAGADPGLTGGADQWTAPGEERR